MLQFRLNDDDMDRKLKNIFLYSAFFIAVFIFFAFYAEYILFFQEKNSLFQLTPGYLAEHLNRPGALLVYTGNFFTSFYFYPAVGAMVVASLLLLTVLAINGISKAMTGSSMHIIAFTAGSSLLLLHSGQEYLLLNTLGFLLQLLLLFVLVRTNKFIIRLLLISAIPLWYFISGSFSFIFLMMITAYFINYQGNKRWLFIAIPWLLMALSVTISCRIFYFPCASLLTFPMPPGLKGFQAVLTGLMLLILILLPFTGILVRFTGKLRIPGIITGILIPLLITGLALARSLASLRPEVVQYFLVEKLFYERKYDEIIKTVSGDNYNNQLTSYLANIALCENKQLADSLFSIPQSPDGSTLFLKWERIGEVVRRGGYFYYTIGMINEAHRWAYEHMVMQGYTPEILKLLIRTELISGNHKVAGSYISILKKTVFYRKDAAQFEKFLFNDELVDSDPELGLKRKIKTNENFFILPASPLINLENAFSSDTSNVMAFQYRLAWLFLRKDFLGVVNEIPRLRDLGFKNMPVNVQEAACVFVSLPGKENTFFDGYVIDDRTMSRYNNFYRVFQRYGGDRNNAAAALEQYKNTFWHHVIYK